MRSLVSCGLVLLLGGCLSLPDAVGLGPDSTVDSPSPSAPDTGSLSDTRGRSVLLSPDASLVDAASPIPEVMVDASIVQDAATPVDAERPENEFPRCLGDTAALEATAAGEWGPATRLTRMDVPQDPMAARAAGCEVLGHNVGSGVQGLISLLATDLTSQLQPDDDGRTDVILLVHLIGWSAGQTGSQTQSLKMHVYDGELLEPERYLVSKASYFEPLVDRMPRVTFQTDVSGCSLTTAPGNFTVDLPEVNLDGALTLVNTTIRAHIRTTPRGFDIMRGMLTGYLSEEVLVTAVLALQDSCRGDRPPSVCDIIGGFVENEDPLETVRRLLLPLLGGADVRIDGDQVADDCGDDCNAVGVCILVEGVATKILGLNTCKDGIINGTEIDEDCGGHCPACEIE
ncbi:MAG: hypothetical protein VX589_18245 [Myxococcota bacterium]|nr:hypothetical protein [Myxococcota bacterium]